MEQPQGVGTYTPERWLRAFMIGFVGATARHRWFWKPSGIPEAIDRATG